MHFLPEVFDQAIMAVESPRNVPIIGVLSLDDVGRKKMFFTSIMRDSTVRPCDWPIMLLSPEEELLRSIKLTTLENFRTKEARKICNFFPVTSSLALCFLTTVIVYF